MFPYALAGARAAGLALLTAALLAACGSDDSPPTPAATPAASRLVVDTGSAAPVAGGTLTLKAALLAADGSALKGASFAWTSSDPTVATVVSASDKAPAAVSDSVMAAAAAPVGTYAIVQTLAAGTADITATATLADGSRITSVTHLVVQAAPATSYTLVLSPSTVAVTAGGAAQTVTVAVRRSDGVDGVADLTHWSWTSDDASFVATPAADGRSAQVASPNSATAAGAATLTACADAPAGGRLCANAALTRNAALPPTYTVGGTVSGLAPGKSLQLADANGDTQVISADGGFTLPTPRQAASAYAVTVAAQPAGQTCTVANGAGAVPAAANVTNIAIACVQAQFVVVPNRADRTISVYRVNPLNGALAAVPGSPFGSGGQVNDIAFLPSGLGAFAVMVDSSTIVGFQLDPTSGALSAVAGAVPTGGAPQAVTMHPSGQSLFVGTGTGIQAYTIAPGTFNLTSTVSVWNADGTGQTRGVAVSPNGKFLYGANARADQVLWVTTDENGAISSFPDFFPAGGSGSNRLTVAPNSGHLYVANFQTNTIGVATLDASGNASAVASFPSNTASPVDVAITPSGNFAYVLGTASNSIAGFRLDPTSSDGLPVAVLPTIAAGVNGQRLSIDPTGRYLYTPSITGALYGFQINGATGALTPVPGSPFATGSVNTAVVIVEPKP